MKKSEIFGKIISEVCEICEVREESILAGVKLQAVVDARVLAVQYMRRAGMSNDDIALIVLRRLAGDMKLCPSMETLRKKSKGVDKMFRSYSERCLQSYAFCLMAKDLADFCRENYLNEITPYSGEMKSLPERR